MLIELAFVVLAATSGVPATNDKAPVAPATSRTATPAATAPAAPPPAASAAALKRVVKSATGGKAWEILIQGDDVEVGAVGGERYSGRARGEKREYRTASGAAFVEVKSSENGFKLRTPDSKLLWKVKFDGDKIKISDNEENNKPWVLKIKEDKIKILDPAEQEIGELKFQADSGKIKVKDAAGAEKFSIESDKKSAAYGVLLMSGVPEQYRPILMAEILAHFR